MVKISSMLLLLKITKNLLDIDECLVNNGNCGEGNVTRANCVNTIGSFMCNCNTGFEDAPICSGYFLWPRLLK